MADINDREKALEGYYFYKADRSTAIKARSYKYLGLWAAELLGITDQGQAIDYAMELVIYEYNPKHEGDAVGKILHDFKSAGIKKDRYDIEDKLEEIRKLAKQEITGDE